MIIAFAERSDAMEKAETGLLMSKLRTQHSPVSRRAMPWKLNQELPATVVNSSPSGKFTIQIGGEVYTSQSSLYLESGKSLIVKVVSLHPQIGLAIVSSGNDNRQAEKIPAAVLSSQLIQEMQKASNKSVSNLLTFLDSFNLDALRSLPAETLSLINMLKKKLLKPGELSDPAKLRAAILQSGLLLESQLLSLQNQTQKSIVDIGDDLKAILISLYKSLDNRQLKLPRRRLLANTSQSIALSSYLDNGLESSDVRMQLLQEVEEALSRITKQQSSSVDDSSTGIQRWPFELTVKALLQPLTIPITIYRDQSSREESLNQPLWGAEFSLRLKNSGFISAKVKLIDFSVFVSMRSEFSKTAQYLNDQHRTLDDSLNRCGLTLQTFSSDCIA